MAEPGPQKDAMDVLQAWVDDYNTRARPALRLGSAGEAGGAQLRLKYTPAEGSVSILHLVAVGSGGAATMHVRRVQGPARRTAEAARSRARAQHAAPRPGRA